IHFFLDGHPHLDGLGPKCQGTLSQGAEFMDLPVDRTLHLLPRGAVIKEQMLLAGIGRKGWQGLEHEHEGEKWQGESFHGFLRYWNYCFFRSAPYWRMNFLKLTQTSLKPKVCISASASARDHPCCFIR